jgi:hypothetical protein
VAVAGLTEIFLQESDPRLRAKVGSVLLAYADAGLKLHPVPTDKERRYDELIRVLEELATYPQGVVTPEPEPLIVTDGIPLPTESDKEAAENENLEVLAHNATEAEAPIGAGSEGPAPEVKFDLVSIPGHFPPRWRVQRRG